MSSFRDQIHASWREALSSKLDLLDEIEQKISPSTYLPSHDLVLKAFDCDLNKVKAVIFGQDPYPNPQYPVGLAFSINKRIEKLPQSLRNIYRELQDDLRIPEPRDGDLSGWVDQGVLLLNRVLTIDPIDKSSHLKLGWLDFTNHVARILGERDVVAILWGESARELEKNFIHAIVSPHPSPLSAYRGFFGSKPFSRTNQILNSQGEAEIDWRL